MTYDKRFYGIYEGICTQNYDILLGFDSKYKIKVKVPQVLGNEETDWILPCLPVTDNSNHPDHQAHSINYIAGQFYGHDDHVYSGTTGSGGTDGHTHSFSFDLSHNNNHSADGNLYHPHVTTADTTLKWNDKVEKEVEQELEYLDGYSTPPEHTLHRTVPSVGQKVWIMFVAGDPNYPIWMGVGL